MSAAEADEEVIFNLESGIEPTGVRQDRRASPRGRESGAAFESMQAVTQPRTGGARPGFPKRKEFVEKGGGGLREGVILSGEHTRLKARPCPLPVLRYGACWFW